MNQLIVNSDSLLAGWQTSTLGTLCDVLDKQRIPITKKDRVPGEYPYYGATGILDYVDDFIFNEKLILIGEDGAKWGAGENTAFTAEGKYWVNNHAHVIRPHRNVVLDEWIIYYLNANDLSPFITGLTVPKLNQGKLKEIPLPIPPLAEQKRIVAILDEAFVGINQMVANAKKNIVNARELFESQLNGIFTQNGEEWLEKTLSDVCSITSKLIDPRAPDFIDLPHIGAGNIVSMSRELIKVQTAREEGLKSAKFCFDDRMVLYSKIRPYLMKVALPDFDGLCSADVYPLSPNRTDLDRGFLYYLLLSKNFTDYAIAGSQRAGMPKVNRDHLFRYRASFPDVPEQQQIVAKLNQLFSKAQHLEAIYQQKLSALTELKQSTLRKAFTGELTAGIVRQQVSA